MAVQGVTNEHSVRTSFDCLLLKWPKESIKGPFRGEQLLLAAFVLQSKQSAYERAALILRTDNMASRTVSRPKLLLFQSMKHQVDGADRSKQSRQTRQAEHKGRSLMVRQVGGCCDADLTSGEGRELAQTTAGRLLFAISLHHARLTPQQPSNVPRSH